MVVNTGKNETFKPMEAADFFLFLTRFSQYVTTLDNPELVEAWDIDAHGAPLKIDNMELFMSRFLIAHRAVKAAQALMATGFPVYVRKLNLDPRLICTTNEDVQEFVSALTSSTKDLMICTGMEVGDDFIEVIDAGDQDIRDTIDTILDVVARVEHVHELNLGGLLILFDGMANRQQIWSDIFQHIFARDTPPDTISFEDNVFLCDDDADCIRDEAAWWRQKHAGKKLCIKNLKMRLHEAPNDAIEELLNAVDDVESLEVTNHNGSSLPTRVLYRILSYPSLKRLTVGRAIVPSMDIFDPSVEDPNIPTKPILDELNLEDLMLEDKSSMLRFIEKLRLDDEEPSELATSLQVFCVTQGLGWEDDIYVSSEADLQSLDRALATNRVLRYVEMLADHTQKFYRKFVHHFKSYHMVQLVASQTTRRSDIAKARNLAFLSTIREVDEIGQPSSARTRLDVAVVSQILEFAAPHQMRKAKLHFWEH